MKTKQYLKAWIIFFLVATVGAAIVEGIIGAVLGAIMGASGIPVSTITMVTAGTGFLLGLPISFLTFRWSIQRYILPYLELSSGSLSGQGYHQDDTVSVHPFEPPQAH